MSDTTKPDFPEWYLYIEGKTPKRVFGGPGAREAACAVLVNGMRLTNHEQFKIKGYLEGGVPQMGLPLQIVGLLDKGIQDRFVMRILGPRDETLSDSQDLVIAKNTED